MTLSEAEADAEGGPARTDMIAAERTYLPGIYGDIPEDDYHASPGVSVSRLKLFKEAPAKVRVPRADRPALRFGRLGHLAILQPHLLEDRYHVVDLERISAREKATKDAMAAAGGRELVKRADWDTARAMRDAIQAHPTLREWFGAPEDLTVESSFYWTDPVTGLLCRGRADGIRRSWRVCLDLKCVEDASPEGFAKTVGSYDYHMQDAHYRAGIAATWGELDRFYFIAIEKEPPFLAGIYELMPQAQELGRLEVMANLEGWARCEASGIWPGYSEEPEPLDLPGWAYAASKV